MNQETGSAQETGSHETGSAQNDRLIHRMNQILSGIVACAVLGVAGVMAYQNRDSIKAPAAKDGVLAGFLKKKFATATAFPQANLPEFQAPDWEKNAFIDPNKTMGSANQFGPAQFPSTTSSSSHRRRP
jgi:hypothetical protein